MSKDLKPEQINGILKEIVDGTLQNVTYHYGEVKNWTKSILEKITNELNALNKPFKYVINCVIIQKSSNTGFHLESSCIWDSTTDANFTYRFETKSSGIICLATVYALAI